MLVGYSLRERILIEVDLFSANFAEVPFTARSLRTIDECEWRVDQVLTLHGQFFEIVVLVDAARLESSR
jgi:hypothetical protein